MNYLKRIVFIVILYSATIAAKANAVRNMWADSIIINHYTPVISFEKCRNLLLVADATSFNQGDTVLMIQMKGVVIDSTNTTAFGDITNYKNAGNYEYNYVKSVNGNTIELQNVLQRQYDLPDGRVQLVRVPYFSDYTNTLTLTCLPWDGVKGGVLAFNVQNTYTLGANIDISARGFRGAKAIQNANYICDITDFFSTVGDGSRTSAKGEGIFNTFRLLYGRGKLANGGGGGNSTNGGGAGGGNAGAGGAGGKQYVGPLCNVNFANGGIGGISLNYSNANNRIFLGGGGGAGHENENLTTTAGSGGAIAIIQAGTINPAGFKIISNGQTPANITGPNEDGRSAGGAGGTVLLDYTSIIGTLVVEVKGGNGDDTHATLPIVGRHGPGGGGGGGVVWINKLVPDPNLSTVVTGGVSGVNLLIGNDPWGAEPGENGKTLTNLVLPIDNILFKPNIDSVRIKDKHTDCTKFDFDGMGYTNASPVASWQWNFGDGNSASTQNTSHTYATDGLFNVKLIVTDVNGCKDSITKNVNSVLLTLDAGKDTLACPGLPITLNATSTGTGGITYTWTPQVFLDDATQLNPIATINVPTKFYITATSMAGCSRKDSVHVNIRSANSFSVNTPAATCNKDSAQLIATGGDTYTWLPATGLSSPTISNPVASPGTTTGYLVEIKDTLCGNTATLPVTVTIMQLPEVMINKSNDISCDNGIATLTASGGIVYAWTPNAAIPNPSAASITVSPTSPTWYNVTIRDANGCRNKDSIEVKVAFDLEGGKFYIPSAFTPNNDGKNDCFGVQYWGPADNFELSVYNRWGERVFITRNTTNCWDGTYKGIIQPSATYVYQIKAISPCSKTPIYKKGHITLIR